MLAALFLKVACACTMLDIHVITPGWVPVVQEFEAMLDYDVTGVGLNLGTAEEFKRKVGPCQMKGGTSWSFHSPSLQQITAGKISKHAGKKTL